MNRKVNEFTTLRHTNTHTKTYAFLSLPLTHLNILKTPEFQISSLKFDLGALIFNDSLSRARVPKKREHKTKRPVLY